jgi:hypothetical protein
VIWILFENSNSRREAIGVSQFVADVESPDGAFDQALQDELREAGLLDPERLERRESGHRLLLRMGVVGFILLFVDGWPGLLGAAGAGLFLASIIGGRIVSALPLSHQGELAASWWRGYAQYLEHLSRNLDRTPTPEEVDTILPYIMAFELTAPWSRALKRTAAPGPSWLKAANAGDLRDLAGLTAVIAHSGHREYDD